MKPAGGQRVIGLADIESVQVRAPMRPRDEGRFMSQGIERALSSAPEIVGVGSQTTVHVVERLAPGGIETLVLDIVGGGAGTLVFSLQGDRPELLKKWPALGPIRERMEGFRRNGLDLRLIPRLARALREANAKAVFLHHLGPLLYGGVAARLAGVPRVIFVEHDAWHYEDRADRLLSRALLKLLRVRVVAVSRQVADRLGTIVPGKEITVIAPGIDIERFAPGDKQLARRRLGLNAGWRIVGSVGRLHPIKGHRFLIEALHELPDYLHAVLVGDGPVRAELEQLAKELALSERVHFLGHRDDLECIYPAFDVFCLPSLSEGLPRTLLEAQASGIPVVATNVGGVPEAVCDVSGLIVPPADANALAAAIRQALDRDTSQSPRSFVVGRMSLKDTVRKYHQLVEA